MNCGKFFKSKRVDAKFCDSNCRAKYSYQKKGGTSTEVDNREIIVPNIFDKKNFNDKDKKFLKDFFMKNEFGEELHDAFLKYFESENSIHKKGHPFVFILGSYYALSGGNMRAMKLLLEKKYLK